MPPTKTPRRPRVRGRIPPPFAEVSDSLERLALKWSLAYRLDHFDDLFDLATAVYLRLVDKYDGTYDFGAYLKYKVWMAFSSYRRTRARQHTSCCPLSIYTKTDRELSEFVESPVVAVEVPYFSVEDFRSGLRDDAKTVVSLVFETPKALIRMMRQQGGNRGVTGGRNRGVTRGGYEAHVCLRKYLRENMDWPRRRIDAAFAEIRQALA